MRSSTIFALGALSATALAANDVDFFTAFVGDFQSNKKEYVNYFGTAKSVPDELTSLAKEVITYTDDSYTTLLKNNDLDISSLKDYATGLPWYTRIEEELGGSAAAASADSAASASGSSSGSSGSAKSSTTAGSGGMSVMVPGGALVGVLAVALL